MPGTDVTVFFDGLMVFRFPDRQAWGEASTETANYEAALPVSRCEAGLHTDAPGHEVGITVKKNGAMVGEPRVFRHKRLRKLYNHLWFYVTTGDGGYEPSPVTVEAAFKRGVLNFEAKKLLRRKLRFKSSVLTPLLHLSGGTLGVAGQREQCWLVNNQAIVALLSAFDHVADQVKVAAALLSFNLELAKTDGRIDVGRPAATITWKLSLAPTQALHLEGVHREGENPEYPPGEALIPPIPYEPGASYEIYFENLPLGDGEKESAREKVSSAKEDPTHAAHPAHSAATNFHFIHYFDAFEPDRGIKDGRYAIVEDTRTERQLSPMSPYPNPPCIGGRTGLPGEEPGT